MTSSRRGFSLVELLIVVLIISILAAIAIPNFMNAQIRAKIVQSKANLKTLQTAIQQFQLDYGFMLVDNKDFYSTSWGKKRVETLMNNIGGLHSGVGRTYFPLTSPISYLTSIPQDPFINKHHSLVITNIDLLMGYADSGYGKPGTYRYLSNDPEEKFSAPMDTYLFKRLDGNSGPTVKLKKGEYVLTGVGPYTLEFSTGDTVTNFAGIETFAVTNGVMSSGILILHSHEGLLQ